MFISLLNAAGPHPRGQDVVGAQARRARSARAGCGFFFQHPARLALVGLLFSLSCSSGEEPPRLVILVSIDTLRADHLGFYGYQRDTSPVLDALALEATVFEEAMSTSPWTLPAHATMLTGLYPRRHGLTSHERYLASAQKTLPQLLSEAGYRTAAVVNSHYLSPSFGLDRGFQRYRYVEEVAERREPSTEITDQAMEWLEGMKGSRLFLFLHYYDVHSDYASLPAYEDHFLRPYDGIADGSTAQLIAHREGTVALSPSDAPNLIDRYDAGIRQMDDELGRLLRFLREKQWLDEALLVVTSDHGEEFFEHGGVLHGRTHFQELLRVPLLVRGAGIAWNRRVTTPVSLIDVLPTVLGRARVDVPGDVDGEDLAPLWLEEGTKAPDRHLFSEADHNNIEHDILRAVRHRHLKLHFNRLSGEFRLFDLTQDPEELRDIVTEQENARAALSSQLERFLAEGTADAPIRSLADDEIDRLRSLGYLR